MFKYCPFSSAHHDKYCFDGDCAFAEGDQCLIRQALEYYIKEKRNFKFTAVEETNRHEEVMTILKELSK